MATHVIAVFNQSTHVTSALDRLYQAGFGPADISVLTSENYGKSGFGIEKGTKAAEGAAIGGGITAGVAALIAGLTAVGAVATGGVGLIASGPIVAALAAAGAGAAAGGLIGALVGMGIPEHEAKVYEGQIKKGGTLVSVQATGDRVDLARQILDSSNAESVTTA